MLYNRAYSALTVDNLLANATFLGFHKTAGGLTGVDFNIWLTKPHWDNDKRIEKAFGSLAERYYNQVCLGTFID